MIRANKRTLRNIAWRVALMALIAIPASMLAPIQRAQAAGGIVSDVIPLFGIFSGLHARNKVYTTANAYIGEKKEYYDKLRAKAREQLRARELGGLRDSQVAAYVKVVGLIEGERKTMIDFSESEKRAARKEFIDRVENTIVNRIIASGTVTRVLGALSKGVRSSRDLVNGALDELAGGGSGTLADVQRVRRIASRVAMAGGLIGGKTGERIRAISSRIVQTIDRPTAEIKAGLDQARDELSELESAVEDLQARGVRPTASQATRDVAISVVTGEEADPAIAAIVNLLTGKAGRDGGTFRSRAREALIGAFVARCADIGRRFRETIAKLEAEVAGEEGDDLSVVSLCSEIDLEKIAEEVVNDSAEATSEVSDEIAAPDTNLPPAKLVVENYSEKQGECGVSSNNGDTYCDFAVEFRVVYETPIFPATISCMMFATDLGIQTINNARGTFTLSGFDEAFNVTKPGTIKDWSTCRMDANGETLVPKSRIEALESSK